ncbi:MAG: DHHA1 domain-containing protein [Candidatus Pacebacteria bacterium]|nr:DHHA1 domain-containing protein [Candidatus Paceibacterota bacterium]
MEKNIVILYHAKCFDGFGAAWVCRKEFGEDAEYIPVSDRITPPEGLDGKEVYVVDFSYPKEVLRDLEIRAKRLVVIDHHLSAEENVRSLKEHVFDLDHSGAILTWQYFFPDTEPPLLLKLIEDNDLWLFNFSETKPFIKILGIISFEFEDWDALAEDFEDKEKRAAILEKGSLYEEYWNMLIKQLADSAKEVEFEGYRVYAINMHGIFRSELGNLLANKKPPFAILWGHKDEDALTFSLRGDGSVNVAEIAEKYGGGGNHDTAAFRITNSVTLPFTLVEELEE